MFIERELLVVEMELPGDQNALIGRDLLAECFFTYRGPDCAFELRFDAEQ